MAGLDAYRGAFHLAGQRTDRRGGYNSRLVRAIYLRARADAHGAGGSRPRQYLGASALPAAGAQALNLLLPSPRTEWDLPAGAWHRVREWLSAGGGPAPAGFHPRPVKQLRGAALLIGRHDDNAGALAARPPCTPTAMQKGCGICRQAAMDHKLKLR